MIRSTDNINNANENFLVYIIMIFIIIRVLN